MAAVDESQPEMESAMQVGMLDERVRFERYQSGDDGYGGQSITWPEIATVWAKVQPLSGRERDMASQSESPRNYRIFVRRDSITAAITPKDRAVWRGKNMNIRFVADKGPRAQFLEMEAEEGVAT